jgi:hypothetical protein
MAASRIVRRFALVALLATSLFSALASAADEESKTPASEPIAEVSESPLIPLRTRVTRASPLIPYRVRAKATRLPASAAR